MRVQIANNGGIWAMGVFGFSLTTNCSKGFGQVYMTIGPLSGHLFEHHTSGDAEECC